MILGYSEEECKKVFHVVLQEKTKNIITIHSSDYDFILEKIKDFYQNSSAEFKENEKNRPLREIIEYSPPMYLWLKLVIAYIYNRQKEDKRNKLHFATVNWLESIDKYLQKFKDLKNLEEHKQQITKYSRYEAPRFYCQNEVDAYKSKQAWKKYLEELCVQKKIIAQTNGKWIWNPEIEPATSNAEKWFKQKKVYEVLNNTGGLFLEQMIDKLINHFQSLDEILEVIQEKPSYNRMVKQINSAMLDSNWYGDGSKVHVIIFKDIEIPIEISQSEELVLIAEAMPVAETIWNEFHTPYGPKMVFAACKSTNSPEDNYEQLLCCFTNHLLQASKAPTNTKKQDANVSSIANTCKCTFHIAKKILEAIQNYYRKLEILTTDNALKVFQLIVALVHDKKLT